MLPGQRKSVEPMAARIEPARVGAAHQSLHHFVAQAAWDDAAVLAAVRDMVLPAMEAQAPIRAWIIDDTGMPKKGRHPVGVGRQYCGQVGKQDNCQVAVTLSVATHQASLPIAFRLYLPEAWAGDPTRRAKAGVPEEIAFQTKPQIALAQIRAVLAADVPRGVVVMDAGYGADGELRAGIEELGLAYVAGVQASVSVWPPGTTPLPPKPWSGRGRPPKLIRRDADHKPVSARDLAKTLPTQAWQSVTWREGSKTSLTSRFATVRVRPAHRDYWRAQLRRPGLARLSPSRHALHRSLRLPGSGTGGVSPLWTRQPRACHGPCVIPASPATGIHRCALSATSPHPSPPCASP